MMKKDISGPWAASARRRGGRGRGRLYRSVGWADPRSSRLRPRSSWLDPGPSAVPVVDRACSSTPGGPTLDGADPEPAWGCPPALDSWGWRPVSLLPPGSFHRQGDRHSRPSPVRRRRSPSTSRGTASVLVQGAGSTRDTPLLIDLYANSSTVINMSSRTRTRAAAGPRPVGRRWTRRTRVGDGCASLRLACRKRYNHNPVTTWRLPGTYPGHPGATTARRSPATEPRSVPDGTVVRPRQVAETWLESRQRGSVQRPTVRHRPDVGRRNVDVAARDAGDAEPGTSATRWPERSTRTRVVAGDAFARR